MKSLKSPYIILPILIGLITPAVLFISYLKSKKAIDLSDATYFSDKPLPKAELLNVETNKDNYEQIKEGRVLAIFLTTNCNACQREIELISTFYSEQTTNFRIYGIAVEDENKIKNFIVRHNVKFPILIDKKGRLFAELGVKYFPTKFLIENGIIVKTVIGSSPDKGKLFQDFNLGEAH